jgi:hypothetical protein
MIDIVKLANGNVALYDTASGDFLSSLSPDIVEIQCNINGTVKVVQDNGNVEYFDPANISNTQVLPAAAIAFTGNCADLALLLSTDFFFVVSGGGGAASAITYNNSVSGLTATTVQDAIDELATDLIYTVELMDALTVDFYAPYDLKINSTTNIKNAPSITIQDDGAAYTLTNTIAVGSKITVTASVAGVTNLNITKA